ncbi:MAG: YoaP domain-containing protein [Bacteroidales bacterium]|nr:YoaP domain-containing protein [Bacteroidales bacterium]
MEDTKIIDLTPENISTYGVCGYKDVHKHVELRNKIEWVKEFYPKGLRIKALISEEGGYQGMLEYIPGKYAHRPVSADGYMFIHCLFVGFKKEFKGKGYATSLIDACIEEAKDTKMLGVAVVTRKGSFMADSAIFLKKGFQVVDNAKPDFSLLVLKFDEKSPNPSFIQNTNEDMSKYANGLTILRSAQCPYTEKNVNAIIESAKRMNLDVQLVDLKDAQSVQNSPCPFGTFGLVYNGKVISHHPISNTRFENIMEKLWK